MCIPRIFLSPDSCLFLTKFQQGERRCMQITSCIGCIAPSPHWAFQVKQRHPHNKHGKVEEPSEVHELTSLTGLTVTAASGNWKFLLCLHPAFTDMNKLELTGGALIFKVLFDGRSAYFSFKRYLAAKICFLKYPKIHNYISSCCIDPATVHAPSSTTKSCNSGRSFSSEDKAWRCSDTKHHLGQTSIRNSRELRQFAYHCYLWMQRVSRCALTVRCKNGNPGIDVSWVPPCEVFQSQ